LSTTRARSFPLILTPAKTPPALPVPSICRRCDRSSPTGERFSKTSPTLPATPPFPCSSEQKSRLLSTASYSRNRTPPTSLLPSPTREMALFTYPHPSNLIKCAQVNFGPVAQLARALHGSTPPRSTHHQLFFLTCQTLPLLAKTVPTFSYFPKVSSNSMPKKA